MHPPPWARIIGRNRVRIVFRGILCTIEEDYEKDQLSLSEAAIECNDNGNGKCEFI